MIPSSLLRASLLLLAAALPAAPAAAAQDSARGRSSLDAEVRRQDERIDRGEGAAVLAEAKERAAKEPGSAEAQYLHGRLLGNLGRFDEALPRFEAAVQIDPGFGPGWRSLALVHLRTGEFDRAVREARRAREIDPSPGNAVVLSQALYAAKDRPGAHGILQEELARNPADGLIRFTFAQLLLDEGLLRDAERELRQVLAADADHLAARQMLISILGSTGRGPDAVVEAREAVRRAPKDPRIRLVLASVLAREGDREGAVVCLEEALKGDLPPDLREKVLGAIREIRSAPPAPRPEERPVTMKDVLRLLDSESVEERRSGMRILWERNAGYLPAEAVKRVTDADETVRLYAVRLIGRDGEGGMVGILEVLLLHPTDRSPSPAVRSAAASALVALGSEAALPLLVRLLEEEDEAIFRAAIRGIHAICGRAYVDDPDAAVPAAERPALRERYRKWWREEPSGKHWRLRAAAAVGETRQESLAWHVVPYLLDGDAEVRAAALDCMATLTRDPGWKGLPTGTAEERTAARDRMVAALAERSPAARRDAGETK